LLVCLMVFNATFNNISVISWREVQIKVALGWVYEGKLRLLLEQTRIILPFNWLPMTTRNKFIMSWWKLLLQRAIPSQCVRSSFMPRPVIKASGVFDSSYTTSLHPFWIEGLNPLSEKLSHITISRDSRAPSFC